MAIKLSKKMVEHWRAVIGRTTKPFKFKFSLQQSSYAQQSVEFKRTNVEWSFVDFKLFSVYLYSFCLILIIGV